MAAQQRECRVHPLIEGQRLHARAVALIDLPLKILISEDGQGTVWVSYNGPEYLLERHGLPGNFLQNIAAVATLAAGAAG
ncbi:MAG: hypothetical protein LAO08_10075 [Acidobacteriia bacterium]|nr:hypothetical protein [Terriglobia bacterium]